MGCKILPLPNEILITIVKLGEEIELQRITVLTMVCGVFVCSLCILHFRLGPSYNKAPADGALGCQDGSCAMAELCSTKVGSKLHSTCG